MIRRPPATGIGGFRREEFRAASQACPAIIFICPYGTSIATVRWAIRRLRRDGYHVVAYETTTAVFMAADPSILPDLIAGVREDITAQIASLKSEGVTEFGFFGSSLGSFIFYNCIGDTVPELRWGVFNTGGDIAQGMWRLDGARRQHVMRGWSLARLEAAWAEVQWPEFGRLDGCRYLFVSSRRDTIAPLADITPYLEPMRRAGAQVSVLKVPAIGHLTTIVAGLWRAPRIVAIVRADRLGLASAGSSVRMTDKATSDLWWKNAVIYCADVATWLDSDGDGIGDLAGLTRRLDYLWGLAVNTLWLMPFYRS